MPPQAFLSHSSLDRSIAEQVCAGLESRGLRCWMAPRNLRPGRNYGAAIVDAINQSSALVLIWSRHSNASSHVVREVERAVAKALIVYPLRIEPVTPSKELEYFLAGDHWIDVAARDLQRPIENLANLIAPLTRAGRASVPPDSRLERRRAAQLFNEIAPDEWRRVTKQDSWGWVRRLFAERD